MGFGKPMSLWKMQETTGTTVGDFIGTNTGTATSGNARRFDGVDDKITFTNPIIPLGAKTIKFKFKKASPPASMGFIMDNSQYGTTGQKGFRASVQTNGTIHFSVCKDESGTGNEILSLISPPVCDGIWHEILFTWDGTINPDSAKVYVDDMVTPAASSTPTETETQTPLGNLCLGRTSSGSSPAAFDLDDMQVLDGNGVVIAYWKMDDATYSGFVDSSSNAWVPTITGFTSSAVLTGVNVSGPIVVSDGASGYARRFNGRSDRITFTSKVLPLGAKSIRFKVRNGVGTILANSNDTVTENGTLVQIFSNGSLTFRNFRADATNGSRFIVTTPSNLLNDGNWHEVLLSWDGTTNTNGVQIFVDDMNTPVVQGTARSTETTVASYNLFIGAIPSLSDSFFSGDLKDIQISVGTGTERTNPKDMQIGDFIPVSYAATSNALGTFSKLGEQPDSIISAASINTPNGGTYMVYVGDDFLGRKMLVSDRNVQFGISWDKLNLNGVSSSSGLPLQFSDYVPDKLYSAFIYVDPVNGSDAGSGTELNPYQTITKAIASVGVSGTAIMLKPGTYNEVLTTNSVSASGRESALFMGNANGYVYDVISQVPGQAIINVSFTNDYNYLSSVTGIAQVHLYNLIVNLDVQYNAANLWQNAIFSDGAAGGVGGIFKAYNCAFKFTGLDYVRSLVYINGNTTPLFEHCIFDMGPGTKSYTGYRNNLLETVFKNCIFDKMANWTGTSGSPYIKLYNCIESNSATGGAEVTRVNSIVENVVFDSAYQITNTSVWQNAGEGKDLDGSIADIGVYGGQFAWNRTINKNPLSKSVITARLLAGGTAAADKDNEWDQIISSSSLGETVNPGDNAVWNWSGYNSWSSSTNGTNRGVRGNTTVSTYSAIASSSTSGGFRPVLLVESIYTTKFLVDDGGTVKKYITPGYTEDLCLGGTVSASSNFDSTMLPDNAFNDGDGFWGSNGDDIAWIQYQFSTPQKINKLTMTNRNHVDIYDRTPTTFQLLGSDTGSFTGEEASILSVNETGAFWTTYNQKKEWTFENENSYSFYRIHMTGKQGALGVSSEYQIAEIEMMELGGGWTSLGLTANETLFTSDGMSAVEISSIPESAWVALGNTPKLLCWTDGSTEKTATITAIPDDQILLPTGNITLPGQGISGFNLTSNVAGSADLKVLASVDGGVTWKSFNGTTWSTVDTTDLTAVKTNGMTPSTFNAITTDQWNALIGTGTNIRFAYYLEQSSSTDIINVDAISYTANAVSTETPTLDSLKVTFDEVTIEGRMQDLEKLNAINLSKLNFKSNALLQSTTYELHDMIVDTFESNATVETATATYNSAEKAYVGTTTQTEVILPTQLLPSYRRKFMLNVDEEGTNTYEYSLDGGSTWTTVTPHTIIDLSGKSGSNLKVKAKLNGSTSKLKGMAFSWM